MMVLPRIEALEPFSLDAMPMTLLRAGARLFGGMPGMGRLARRCALAAVLREVREAADEDETLDAGGTASSGSADAADTSPHASARPTDPDEGGGACKAASPPLPGEVFGDEPEGC